MLRFFNTLSRQVEEFHPLDDNKVRMYMCGPTVWNFAHIGNFRTFIFGDVLRRYLKFKGYDLTHVMNLTDIDDRIINEANGRGISIDEFTEPYTQYFLEDFDALGNERPEIMPRATHHIPEMVDIIQKLLENDHAYESDGSIYYRITAFPEYGKLSKINLSGNIAGGSERVDTDKYDKEDARDFALWKLVGPDDQPGWDAPFGRGRPGWHIECSAMSMKYLGETFDLHGGGMDLQFPHHENEIAQSEGSSGKPFVRVWAHNGFLNVDNEKMSKSLGNFFTLRDVLRRYDGETLRFFMLRTHYRSPFNFSDAALDDAKAALTRLYTALDGVAAADAPVDWSLPRAAAFRAAMDDDFNTPGAVAVLFDLAGELNRSRSPTTAALLRGLGATLGILQQRPRDWLRAGSALDEATIAALIAARAQAKRGRDFGEADRIRRELAGQGIELQDTPQG